ncbi:energy transducer TonB [Hymenobacter arizonensis]|uniref:TonB protein C-terminal n=1 Tax=Hymenobacter arizonensis TaxID=1227077 RepID=A0A1I6BHD6_HYMAR|nr:energy transducer TonB [Hymenobacter arizonensis]SFQ80350.1 TonB protein C-terminal [Hymenobacter arizonensis]
MIYIAIQRTVVKSPRRFLCGLLVATGLLCTSRTALAQTPLQTALDGGRSATLAKVVSRQLREADSVARVTGRQPDRMRIDKIDAAAPHRGFVVVTSAAGAVEELPALASGGGMGALVEAVEQQLASAPGTQATPRSETRVYALLTIDADGKVQHAKIVDGPDAAINAAVLAAIQRLPRLSPGQVAGTAVPVKLTIPVQVKS